MEHPDSFLGRRSHALRNSARRISSESKQDFPRAPRDGRDVYRDSLASSDRGSVASRPNRQRSALSHMMSEDADTDAGPLNRCLEGGFHNFRLGRCTKCGLGEGVHLEKQHSASRPGGRRKTVFKESRKTCPTCHYSWLDKYDKNECPKCQAPLSRHAKPNGRRMTHAYSQFAVTARPDPEKLAEEQSRYDLIRQRDTRDGECKKGGKHVFRLGRCRKCGLGHGAHFMKQNTEQQKGVFEKRKKCPTCFYEWVDKYDKNECPKCLRPLDRSAGRLGRVLAHTDVDDSVVTALNKGKGYAKDREAGVCPKGGKHVFRFGFCKKCKLGEGEFDWEQHEWPWKPLASSGVKDILDL